MPRKFERPKTLSDKINLSDFKEALDYLEALIGMRVIGGRFVINRTGATLDVSSDEQTKIRLMQLTADLDEATLDGPTRSTGKFYIPSNDAVPPALAITDVEDDVYNYSDVSFAVNTDVWVVRLDVGHRLVWTVLPPVLPQRVRFEIDSVYDATRAEATVLSVACSMPTPATYTITVYDKLGCLFDETEDALIGRKGYATKMREVGSGECFWEVDSLCCAPSA